MNLINFFLGFFRKPRTEVAYYTTDGGKLAPYPDMTDSDLRDFEIWANSL